jgi:hypothetical protein
MFGIENVPTELTWSIWKTLDCFDEGTIHTACAVYVDCGVQLIEYSLNVLCSDTRNLKK